MFLPEETLVLPAEAHCTYRAPLNVETRRRLTLALAITAVVMVVEFVGGWLSGSLALLADAAHMLADVAALGLALIAAWIAQRPATPQRSFGFMRLEILAALVNGAVLFAIAIGIGVEAWRRVRVPPAVNGALLLGVAAVGFVANLGAVSVLHRGHEHSLNQRGAYLHVLSDLLGSVGALIAGFVVLVFGWTLADPVISVLIGALVLGSAWRLVKESTDVLLEATPTHIALSDVHDRIASVPGVDSVHDLHLWTVTSGMVAMSGHLVVKNPTDNQPVLEEVQDRMRALGIAHVTVLVEQMLRQAGVFRANQQVAERVMDSNPLERERGITILAKNTSVRWGDTKINIVDTPGHADFGGEVERILRMVDGFLLLVDAAEGPMPQTRFVAGKALALGLKPIVLVNKVDRPDAEPLRVHDEVLELLMDLDASPEQFNCPFLYTSSRAGTATLDLKKEGKDLTPLFETILGTIPAPKANPDGPLQMLISTLDYSSYLGRIGIGRIERGRMHVGDTVALLPIGEPGPVGDGKFEQARVVKLFAFEGLERVELETAAAGEIVAIAGLAGVEIGKTVTAPDHLDRLAGIAVEEPTISVDMLVNNSPLAGREGKFVTGRQLRERLYRELERNVALRVEDTDTPYAFTVSGRGELHLGILMETMRREGYEFQVSRPRIIPREGPNGERLEPYEELMIDCPEGYLGVVMEKLGPRRAELLDMRNTGLGMVRMRFKIPARGLLGYRSEFLTDTRGTGIMHHRFFDYGPWAGPLQGRSRGVMVADREGVAVAYALFNLQERGTMFVKPGDAVYEGMIVGESARTGDMDVNPSKEKKLTNMRTTASDEMIVLEPPRPVTLELALEYIEDDELIEITPSSIRLRKRELNATERRKLARSARAAEES